MAAKKKKKAEAPVEPDSSSDDDEAFQIVDEAPDSDGEGSDDNGSDDSSPDEEEGEESEDSDEVSTEEEEEEEEQADQASAGKRAVAVAEGRSGGDDGEEAHEVAGGVVGAVSDDTGQKGAGSDDDGDGAQQLLQQKEEEEEWSSSEDERMVNTVGDVPMEWYKDEDHIGYDREGEKIMRKHKPEDALDAYVDLNDNPDSWRTVYDPVNDEKVKLSMKECDMLRRIESGKFPHSEFDQYAPMMRFIKHESGGIHPLINPTAPKAGFVPSKWEAKKVIKIIRAMRRGDIRVPKTEEQLEAEELQGYLLWGDDNRAADAPESLSKAQRTRRLMHAVAPKVAPPGHAESYNPPEEYLPSEEELLAWKELDPEDRPFDFIPKKFGSMREVAAYPQLMQERFHRCLDLYLAPRSKRTRLNIDPESLVPKLPKPRELRPFPTEVSVRFRGHSQRVRGMAVDPSGQWLASGSDDQTLRLWEVETGKQLRCWELEDVPECVAWSPNPEVLLLAVAVGSRIALVLPGKGLGSPAVQEASLAVAQPKAEMAPPPVEGTKGPQATWEPAKSDEWQHEAGRGIAASVRHRARVTSIAWHPKGSYLAAAMSSAVQNAVLIHRVQQRATISPFQSMKSVQAVSFHPRKAYLLHVVTKSYIRIYDLQQQVLKQKLMSGVKHLSSIAIHPSGDHIICGSYDKRLCWFDTDLSTKPYRVMRSHTKAIRSVAFHRTYPLCASTSDDGCVHVYHSMVYDDLSKNALIVPVKVLKGHAITRGLGVLHTVFHPTQPWLFSSGADGNIFLYTNVH
jgi:ribosome biogenesis protein ERB1